MRFVRNLLYTCSTALTHTHTHTQILVCISARWQHAAGSSISVPHNVAYGYTALSCVWYLLAATAATATVAAATI